MSIRNKLVNIFFQSEDPEEQKETKQQDEKKKSWTDFLYEDPSKPKRSIADLFFEDDSSKNGVKSTFVNSDNGETILEDIESKITLRESELINLSSFFQTVNPTEYPDSRPEYEAYLSLVDQLNKIKGLSTLTTDDSINTMNRYQLESAYKKFELDYKTHINAIQSLCYLSEIATLNSSMEQLFSSHFTAQVEHKIDQSDNYIALISKKSSMFDKKYAGRIYKELIESEYRLTILKLMSEIKCSNAPYKNPFSGFSEAKKKAFETFLSKDVRTTNAAYNRVISEKGKYIKYGSISPEKFDSLDASASVIAERINQYTIDDFRLSELLENGEGYETLKRFLKFKLNLNYIDSKTRAVDKASLDDEYQSTTSRKSSYQRQTIKRISQGSKKYPNFDDDL